MRGNGHGCRQSVGKQGQPAFQRKVARGAPNLLGNREAEVLGVDSFSDFNALHSRQHD
jgi:hypothetical protein